MMKKLKVLMIVALVILVGGCSSKKKEFVVAYLPQEETSEVVEVQKRFEEELSNEIGLKVVSYQATSYNAAIEAMAKGKVDLAMFGPFSYTVAKTRANAKALVVVENPAIDKNSPSSCFIVREDSNINSIEDTKGKIIAFGDPVSTTGNLFPKYKLIEDYGLTLDDVDTSGKYFKESTFSGGHDKTVIGVAQGTYDVGAAYCGIIDILAENGVIKKDELKVIEYAGEGLVVSAPMAISTKVDEKIQTKVKDFLLNYKDEAYFTGLGMKGGKFVEADETIFDKIAEVGVKLGLSEEELLGQ